jgi:hypothetical protein
LPSAFAKALGKDTGKGAHWRVLCRVPVHQTLGKETSFAECLLELSAQGLAVGSTGPVFAECRRRHSAKDPSPSLDAVTVTFLCRVPVHQTLGKETSFAECLLELSAQGLAVGSTGPVFAESRRRHSAKDPSPSLGAVTVTFLFRVPNGTRQSLCRVPDKKYSAKMLLPMYSSPSVLCRVLHSAKPLPSVK